MNANPNPELELNSELLNKVKASKWRYFLTEAGIQKAKNL